MRKILVSSVIASILYTSLFLTSFYEVQLRAAAFTFIIGGFGVSVGGGSASTTQGSGSVNATGANFSACAIISDTSDTAYSVTDSSANSYTGLTLRNNAAGPTVTIYYNQGGTYGATFSWTVSNAVFPAIACRAYSGAASSPFDVQNGNTCTGAANCTTNSITPNFTAELIFAAAGWSSANTGAAVTNLTLRDTMSETGDAWGGADADEIQTSIVSRSASFSKTGNADYATAIAGFKSTDSSGGGGGATGGFFQLMGCCQ